MTGNAKRVPRLKLSARDHRELKRMKAGGEKLSARTWRRILTLEHLDSGLSVRAAAAAVGGYHREVGRVLTRFLADGLQAALRDDPRPGGARKLDSVEEAAVVALVCGPPPDGNARWTVRLVTTEVMKRGIVRKVGRETIRVTLANHELKPWREKNVVRAGDQRRVRRTDGGRAAPVRAAAGPAGARRLPR
ncbi:MAG: helix-turn-helix domain-containing protein [Myxococcales bacterium]|nr:helix-turn-helix domain-containing protein [Myxococcales bacterium]